MWSRLMLLAVIRFVMKNILLTSNYKLLLIDSNQFYGKCVIHKQL